MRLGISTFDLWPELRQAHLFECIGSVTLHLYSICLVNSGGTRHEDRFRNSSRALLASACGLLLSTGAVAASGYNITPEQIGLIKAGMNQGEVLKAVGEPVDTRSYGKPARPTGLRLLAQGDRTVDVDFDSSGRVVSPSIRLTTQAIPATTGNSPSGLPAVTPWRVYRRRMPWPGWADSLRRRCA